MTYCVWSGRHTFVLKSNVMGLLFLNGFKSRLCHRNFSSVEIKGKSKLLPGRPGTIKSQTWFLSIPKIWLANQSSQVNYLLLMDRNTSSDQIVTRQKQFNSIYFFIICIFGSTSGKPCYIPQFYLNAGIISNLF